VQEQRALKKSALSSPAFGFFKLAQIGRKVFSALKNSVVQNVFFLAFAAGFLKTMPGQWTRALYNRFL